MMNKLYFFDLDEINQILLILIIKNTLATLFILIIVKYKK